MQGLTRYGMYVVQRPYELCICTLLTLRPLHTALSFFFLFRIELKRSIRFMVCSRAVVNWGQLREQTLAQMRVWFMAEECDRICNIKGLCNIHTQSVWWFTLIHNHNLDLKLKIHNLTGLISNKLEGIENKWRKKIQIEQERERVWRNGKNINFYNQRNIFRFIFHVSSTALSWLFEIAKYRHCNSIKLRKARTTGCVARHAGPWDRPQFRFTGKYHKTRCTILFYTYINLNTHNILCDGIDKIDRE